MNKKALREDFECLRQGYRDILDFVALNEAQRMSFQALHRFANSRAVSLGGEDVSLPSHINSAEFLRLLDLQCLKETLSRLLERTSMNSDEKLGFFEMIEKLEKEVQ